MSEDYVQKCLDLYEQHDVLKPKRDREFLEQRKDIKKYYIQLRKRLDKERAETSSTYSAYSAHSDEQERNEREVRFKSSSIIPDMSAQVQQSYAEMRTLEPPPEPEVFYSHEPPLRESYVVTSGGWGSAPQKEEGQFDIRQFSRSEVDDTSARKLRLKLLLARDDLNDDAMKILEKTRKLKIDQMGADELDAMEELASLAISKHYAKTTGQKILHSVSNVIEKSTQRPEGTVSKIVDEDKLLQEDFATVLGRYAVGTSVALRAAVLFAFDVGSALFGSSREATGEATGEESK